MTRRPAPATIATNLAAKLGIKPAGVRVAADGSVTIFDAKGAGVLSAANERAEKADAALEGWLKAEGL